MEFKPRQINETPPGEYLQFDFIHRNFLFLLRISRALLKSIIVSFSLLLSVLSAQPRLSGYGGIGLYSPSLVGLDSDSNSVIPNTGSGAKNLLLDWGFQYQFYPNARIGLSMFYSLHSGKIGSSDYFRVLSYRMLTLETFFFLRKRMELNFTLAPMWNKGRISLTASTSTDDWDNLLASYGNGTVSVSSGGSMVKRWFGLGSTIGFRYYIFTWLAVDGKIGFFQNYYSKKNWKLGKKKITGPELRINKLPVYTLHMVIGW